MPLIATRGAASAQGFGEFAQTAVALYVEDVFSTYLYTGNGSTQTITNGIDLSGEGGLTWLKVRNFDYSHLIIDSARGISNTLITNGNDAQFSGTYISSYNSDGFTLDGSTASNQSGRPFASWTFRKQPKFFDVVTYTGNGVAGRAISHNLGSTPGCVIVKATDLNQNWTVYHRSIGGTKALVLNLTAAADTDISYWNNSDPTSTTFIVGGNGGSTNNSGTNYVAYLFAHDAGGFGLTGTDNVISCGSYTGTGSSGNVVTLGYEPQWVMIKNATTGSAYTGWVMMDNMRGMPVGSADAILEAQSSAAEGSTPNGSPNFIEPRATGFELGNGAFPACNASGDTYIYIAIRRGPMKTPTSGTSVFAPVTYTGDGATRTITTGFPVDLYMGQRRTPANVYFNTRDRLRGKNAVLQLPTTNAEFNNTSLVCNFDVMTGVYYNGINTDSTPNAIGESDLVWGFRRAPGFFDEVCYTGNSTAGSTITHNLGVVPQLMIVKARNSSAFDWYVYSATTGNNSEMYLNLTNSASGASSSWNTTTPTASVFTLGGGNGVNGSAYTYVAYLFASCPGVSKCGSYTGTGTTNQINCGFSGGARFVLIKRTDSTGDWYVWDSARGIVAGNDPYLLLNSTAAEVTNTDYVDTYSAGFEISSTAPAAINANGGTFIFLAIA